MSEAWENEERDERGRWSGGGGGAGAEGPFQGPNELAPEERPAGWGYQNTAAETLSDSQNPLTDKQGRGWETWQKAGGENVVGYRQINETLRGEGTVQQEATAGQRVEIGSSIQRLDQAVNAQDPIARDITVYRAVSGEAADAYGSLGTGDHVIESSFMATTPDEETAHEFLRAQAPETTAQFRGFGQNPEQGQVMRVDVPAGTRMLAPEASVQQGAEALLPRGGTLVNVGPMHFRYGG